MPKRLKNLKLRELSLVDVAANEHSEVVLIKRGRGRSPRPSDAGGAAGIPQGQTGGNPMTSKNDGGQIDPADVQKATEAAKAAEQRAEAAEATVKAMEAAVEAAGAKVEKADDGTVKSITLPKPEPAEEMIDLNGEKVAKSAVPAAVLKALRANEEQIAKLHAEREEQALKARAVSEIPNLSGDEVTKAAILKAVDAIADDATREAAHQVLKGASETVGLLAKSAGSGTAGRGPEPEPVQKYFAAIKKAREIDPTLTEAQAEAKVYRENPALADEYTRAIQGSI